MAPRLQLILSCCTILVVFGRVHSQLGHFGEQCVTAGGSVGTCVSAGNCIRLKGRARGFCSLIGEICCERSLQCNQASKMKRTILSSDQLTNSPTQNACSYTIEAFSPNVCQLLIEFEKFNMGQPTLNAAGDAKECRDFMRIGGKFQLCGNMDKQHLYMPFKGATTISVSYTDLATWHVKVTQLECPTQNGPILPFPPTTGSKDYEQLAPYGCDQYYTAKRGTIKSFNYNGENTFLPGLNYVICVKTKGEQRIEYTMNHFAMGPDAGDYNYNEGCKSTIKTVGRSEDYLMIPQSTIVDKPMVQSLLYCGVMPTNTKIIAQGPFIMYFVSDTATNELGKGFSIEYEVK